MRKRFLKTITVLCLLCGFFVPVRVNAESSYLSYSANDCISVKSGSYQGSSFNFHFNSNVNGRFVIIKGSANSGLSDTTIYFVSDVYGNASINRDNCSVPSSNLISLNNYYYFTIFLSDYGLQEYIDAPVYVRDTSIGSKEQNAIYYTYGEGAVDPPPPAPDYGDLADVRFNTDIAGSGTAAVNNIDHIKWNPENDSNGITFDGTERVEVQAIPGNYTASSKNALLSLGVTDFDYNSGSEHLLAELPVTNGEYTVSWSHVIEQLNAGSISDFLGIRKSSDTWLKSGWIYQIRLVVGDYVSPWQTIYNATSSGVENSLTVENSTEINMDLINVIQSINTLNSSQYESWTINNITINMENSDGQQTTDKPWWAYLLEAIVKAFGDILAVLGNLIGDLMDAITDLFKPAEFTINEYNDFKVEIKQNSGLFGQAIDFTNDLKNTFMGVQYEEPILHWQGITLDGVVFLPAADYNLNEYVEMWGLGRKTTPSKVMPCQCNIGSSY